PHTHHYHPHSCIDVSRRLCEYLSIPVPQIWSYTVIGDQPRFTLVQRSAVPEVKTRPAAAPPRPAAAGRTAAPARPAANGQARSGARTAAPAARGKAAAKKTARPATRRPPERKAPS